MQKRRFKLNAVMQLGFHVEHRPSLAEDADANVQEEWVIDIDEVPSLTAIQETVNAVLNGERDFLHKDGANTKPKIVDCRGLGKCGFFVLPNDLPLLYMLTDFVA
eukprot:3960640-Amphidinium_carterae.1